MSCPPQIPLFPPLSQNPQITPLVNLNSIIQTLAEDLTTLTSFKTRYFRSQTGRRASEWLHNRIESLISGGAYDASVEYFNHTWIQPSVIARLQGISNTTVIISSHIDSLNLNLPSLLPAPGANDDASGVSALLSILQSLLSSPPLPLKNTLEFHFYSAEEAGLWGSNDIFSTYNTLHKQIHSVLQLDMIGTPSAKIGIVTDFLPESFAGYISHIATKYTSLTPVLTTCGYACSDHASAIRYGYAGGLITSGTIPELSKADYSHTKHDTMDKLSTPHIAEFVKFGIAWMVALGTAELEVERRGYICDNGYPDGWMGTILRFSTARAADPAGFGLWILAVVILLAIARPWEELPFLMRFCRKVKRRFRRGYTSLTGD
ncbi:Leucine aminopeptidase 1 [Arthrobotrys musiformis]|uniref:Peptide hydrolase n=1 Tax=Arthrobotrys musiformis TaxID=47236 RepID=A0AAV9WFB8_9PEZI